MKRFLTTALGSLTAIAVLPGMAIAGGGGSLKDAPVVMEQPSWTGFYLGGSVGYGKNRSKNNYYDDRPYSSSVSESAEGTFISGVFGFDRQLRNNFIIGAFADFDISDLERGSGANALTISRSWAVGGRVGYAVSPRTMIFATGGYTEAYFRNDGWWDIDVTGGTLRGRRSRTFSGYFVGGGFETRLRSNFFLRGEARYANYREGVTNSGVSAGTTYVDQEDPEIFTGRIGVIYKLGRHQRTELTEASLKDDGGGYGHTYKVVTINGVDISKDAWAYYNYTGFALNGDYARDGLLFRTLGHWSEYSYSDTGTPSTEYDVEDRALDLLIGYQKHFDRFTAAIFVGYEIRDIEVNPNDLTKDVRGTVDGFKIAAEIETKYGAAFYAAADASYSTVFDTYTGEIRLGVNTGRYIIGPEASIYGDEEDRLTRLGAFAKFPFTISPTKAAEITVNGGYQFADDSSTTSASEGGYGGLSFKVAF